jgi:EpsI family protein
MKHSSALVACTALMLGATLTASLLAGNRAGRPLARPLDRIPTTLGDWIGVTGPAPDDRQLELLAATSYLSRNYRRPGGDLNLFIAYYALQKAGESMHTPKNCLPATGWEITKFDEAELSVDGRAERINRYTIQNGDSRAVVLYWYQTSDRIIASEYEGKVFLVWDAIIKGRTDGSVIRITTRDNPKAVEDALGFARAIESEMKISLGS